MRASLSGYVYAGAHYTKRFAFLQQYISAMKYKPFFKLHKVITQVCTSAMQPITTMFGGQLGEVDLDVIGLANTVRVLTLSWPLGDSLNDCYCYKLYLLDKSAP